MCFVKLESACKKWVKHQAQFKKSFSVLVDCSPRFCLALLVFLAVPSYFSVSHPSQEVSRFLVLCHIVYTQEWHLQFQSKWVELCERSFSPCRLSVVVVIRKNVNGGLCKKDLGVFFFSPSGTCFLQMLVEGFLKLQLALVFVFFESIYSFALLHCPIAQFYFYVRRKKDFCLLDTVVV